MRTVRVFFLLLLSLAIPVYGYAGLGTFEQPCAMAVPMLQHAASGHGADVDAPCCDDAELMASTDHPCKAGQDCGGGGLALLLPGSALGLQAPQPVLHRFQADSLVEPDRAQVWRPPALP